MMKPPEQVGAVPQAGVNPQAQPVKGVNGPQMPQDPRQQYGITDEDLDYFRHDPEIIAAIRAFTGRDFPMDQIDDALIVQIAGAVHKLGVEGAVAEFKRIIPPRLQAQIRAVAMKQNTPRVGGQ